MMRRFILPAVIAGSGTLYAQEVPKPDTIQPTVRNLQQVDISSKKKTIEFKGDKIVYNVSTSVNAIGSNALALLKQSPGVMLDPSNNITLNGKAGVTVYIDGKPTYMQGEALTAMLRSLQSANVQSIEVMPNPSGKYDAAGSGGIINIRLKKLNTMGFNADVSAGVHFGETPKTEAALNMNYRNGKWNWYGNYNHYFGYRNMNYGFYREQASQKIDNNTIDTDMRNPVNFKTGLDYAISSRHTLGAMMNANLYFGPGLTNTYTTLADSATGKLQSVLQAKNDYYSQRQNWKNFNINYQYKDTSGRLLTVDADYGIYVARIKNILDNRFLAPDGITETDYYALRTLNNSDIRIYGLKTDYEQPLFKGKMLTGLKWSKVTSDNQVQIYDVASTEKLNEQRSNFFKYQEQISAAYWMLDQTLGKWKIQGSVRSELTVNSGRLDAKSKYSGKDTSTVLSNRYLDFFPSLSVSYQGLSLLYNRKIDRPGYADLNPFEYQMDELSYWQGNAFLRPQYSNSVTLGYQAGFLSGTLSYTHINDMFVSVTDSTAKNKMVIRPENTGSQDVLSLNLSSSIDIFSWWQLMASAGVYHKRNHITFDPERTTVLQVNTVLINLQQVWQLSKKTQLEINGFYHSPDLSGFQHTLYVWQLNAGVQYKCLKNNGIIRLSVSDIFHSYRWTGIRDFDGLYYRTQGKEDSRQIKIGFSYRFGNLMLAKERDRNSGLENESRRVK